MSSHDDLRAIALSEFARAGYGATSLQRIAEVAGLSKSSVLYHFASKEALLEAGISPALDRMEVILDSIEGAPLNDQTRRAFITDFVDFLLAYRLEVHLFINQARSLEDVPVIDRANLIVVRLASYFHSNVDSPVDRLRFGIALGGAAYVLATEENFGPETEPLADIRPALITVLTELLAPVPVRPAAIQELI
ncbi:TetR/AcrR family transcriptional regulator [Glaciihabitans sp. dw_435]|uniref:TetR/AcrR family transcriptional regulator n=1 Tax=Glaciihabitans sp. dw_435 TaxID=2720081 RepID=UPI001BD4EBD4|nr:TetR/AcrR family transcriptional regulator [Glaciihabitans sp. dw_435]